MATISRVLSTAPFIDRPTCSTCGALMWLVVVTTFNASDVESRTFECPVCEVSTRASVHMARHSVSEATEARRNVATPPSSR